MGQPMHRRALTPRVGVMCHMFHRHLFGRLAEVFAHIPGDAGLHLTTCSEDNAEELRGLFPKAEIIVVKNRGRDIAPKLIALAPAHENYDLVLHIHTKASAPGWREHILDSLAGSSERVSGILSRFAHDPKLGIFAPDYWAPIRAQIEWGANQRTAEALLRRMNIDPSRVRRLEFPAGSMFWARPAALKPLLDLRLKVEEFPDEPIGSDGTLAHAVERLFYFACERSGYRWATGDQPYERVLDWSLHRRWKYHLRQLVQLPHFKRRASQNG